MTPPTTFDPCAALQNALVQLTLLSSGQATAAIETPQLGRVEYNKTQIGDVQRLIQQLADQCVACGGTLPSGFTYMRRRPLSIEAWP